jgi:hypothetical protein
VNVQILKIIDHETVEVQSDFGIFYGIWKGPLPPVVSNHEVELALIGILDQQVIVQETAIKTEGGVTTITGLIEDEDDDGIKYLRFGSDLIMFEFDNISTKGKYIELKVTKIELYPI